MGRPAFASDAVATSDRLLDAALEEFGRVGFDGARLADIAGAAGISRPSLLYHFGSKEALYTSVVTEAFRGLGEELTAAVEAPGTFLERFDEVLARSARFLEERPALARLLLREMLDDRGPGHALLLEAGLPVVEQIEAWIVRDGRGVVRDGLPLRAALMTLVSSIVNRTAAGPLGDELWGPEDRSHAVAHALFFEHTPEP